MTEQTRAQLWATATEDERVKISLILGDSEFNLTMDVEDAKSWQTTIGKAIQDVVSSLPVADI